VVEREALRAFASDEREILPRHEVTSLLLPTLDGTPLASPELPLELAREHGARRSGSLPSLVEWSISGLLLSPLTTLRWLAQLPHPTEAPPAVRFGADLRYWSMVSRYALELLARQRFLPSLSCTNGHASSVWEPVLDDEVDRLDAIREAMPPVCRALPVPGWSRDDEHDEPASESESDDVGRGVGENLDRGAPSSAVGPHPHGFSPRAALGLRASEALTAADVLSGFLTAVVDEFVREAASRLRLRPRFVETDGERFASSLLERDGTFEEAPSAVDAIQNGLASWRADIREDEEAPFRIAFRLEPPPDPSSNRDEDAAAAAEDVDSEERSEQSTGSRWVTAEGGWQLRYFLQALDDESLLVPVARVWEHGGTTWRHLERRVEHPQELVLEGLGRAATLFPPLLESLREPRPESCALDVEQTYAFLNESAFLLKESGFGVLLPAWWTKRERQNGLGLSLRVTPSPRNSHSSSVSRLGLDALVEFDWQVALGGETLTRDEFLELAELKQPLVRVRGQWVELSEERVDEVRKALSSSPPVPSMALGDVLRIKLGAHGERHLPVTNLTAKGWISELIERLSGQNGLTHLTAPPTFRGKLRPYQEDGLSWLSFLSNWKLGACLADDMGLGKTIQVLALLLDLEERNELDRPFLLICPTSVVGNWRKEAERFAPSLKVLVHHGLDRHEGEIFEREASRHHLVVSTYSLVHRDLAQLHAVSWGGLVLDEAQNIKNPQAKQTKALRQLEAPRRIALTGTPVENRLQELWSIMEFLNPGYLGSEAFFRRHYALPIERYRDKEATQALRRLVAPFVLRRVKTDPHVIKDLPTKNEMKVYCTLTEEQATLYQAVVTESLQKIDATEGIGRKGEVLAALTRLKQICNHPAHFLSDGSSLAGRSGKLARLSEMLDEVLSENDRALVFTQYAEMGKLIQKYIRDALSVDVIFLHGAVPAADRDEMISRFQSASGPPVFVLSLRAGGFGLNLTEARHVFHFDRWWNPAVEDQATDRAFRIGQTRSVAVYKFICAGTVEERVDEMSERKKQLAESIIEVGDSILTELSTERLRELFELRNEAVEPSP
jgi:SNF2 family DNA or RNA helicase